jgi:hypothetical protein
MTTLLVTISTLFAGVALGISVLSYLARNRPYVGVKKLSLSELNSGLTQKLTIEVENVGDVPATDVVANVTDSADMIEVEEFGSPLGVIFPRQNISFNLTVPSGFVYASDKENSYWEDIGEGRQLYHEVFPEGEGVVIDCTIKYKQALAFGWRPLSYSTFQPFHIAPDGQIRPSKLKLANIK